MKTHLAGALLAVLATLTACERTPSGAGPPDRYQDAQQIARGQTVYTQHCMACHGTEGKGPPGDWRIRDADGRFPPPPLDDSAHAWHHPTAALLETVRDGSPGGQGNMPAWNGTLSEQAMRDVVAYIKTLWSDPVYHLWWKMERQSLED
ncbi:MAG: cytochrome c [Thiobacillus sp.]|jgi:mono/diheme cytochrome c family protein